ncbi:MAG: ATP synthase F0 subunit B [Nannocystaceae bacterium]|nr:ATP synthase F0 subunit B [Nannocystaceae bacterium]
MNRIHPIHRALTRATAVAASFLLPAIAYAAAPAHGAEEAHGAAEAHDSSLVFFNNPFAGEEKTALVWLFINFAVLMLILNKLLFVPLRRKTAAKHDDIKSSLEKATAAHEEATSIISEYRGRMEKLDDEIAELKANAKKRAENDRKSIIEAAEAEALRIKESATAAAERDAEGRRKDLENEILDRALERAEAAIRKTIAAGDQRRMADDYVQGLAGMKLGSPGQTTTTNSGGAA